MNYEQLILFGCILLSLVGSLAIITNILILDKLSIFAQKLLFFLSLSDFLFCLGKLMYQFNSHLNGSICVFQATLIQFSIISSFFWSSMISLSLYLSLKHIEQFHKVQDHSCTIILIGFGISLVYATIPILLGSYQKGLYFCEIHEEYDHVKSTVTQVTLLYLPLVISIILSSVFIIKALRYVNEQRERMSVISLELEIQYKFTSNLSLYPMILAFCWVLSLLCYILSECNQSEIASGKLKVASICVSSLQGMLNGLVYLYNLCQTKRLLEMYDKNKRDDFKERESNSFEALINE